MSASSHFTKSILKWYQNHKRPLPWRKTSDPYTIWLSEIILQQTRVDQGLPYFIKFIEKYPNVSEMSKASEEEILKHWQGLGYYSRGRNLLSTAKHVHENLNGKFPNNSKELIKLKGIGNYTANAIASFCFGENVAVVDGNVYRVLSRYFGKETPIDSTEGQKEFQVLANNLLPKGEASEYNQGIMEFGALQCKPKPDCSICPIALECLALRNNKVQDLPFKSRKLKKKKRFFNYLFLYKENNLLLEQRDKQGIWKNLFEFPLIESNGRHLNFEEIVNQNTTLKTFNSPLEVKDPEEVKHILSHQTLHIKIWPVRLPHLNTYSTKSNIFEVSFEEQEEQYAVPIVLQRFITQFKEKIVG